MNDDSPTYNLTLNHDQAVTLATVLRVVGGCPDLSRRRFADEIGVELAKAHADGGMALITEARDVSQSAEMDGDIRFSYRRRLRTPEQQAKRTIGDLKQGDKVRLDAASKFVYLRTDALTGSTHVELVNITGGSVGRVLHIGQAATCYDDATLRAAGLYPHRSAAKYSVRSTRNPL